MAEVEFRAIPAERGRRPGSVTVYCSCCCCCLHSLGGLIGAAAALASQHSALPVGTPTPRVGVLYWLCLQICCAGLFLFPDSEGWGIVGLAMALPLIQIAASVLAMIWIAISRPDHAWLWYRRILKVTGWGFLGAIIGAALLYLAALLL